jgi:photosystem II stability/assembly factor-like uncharacterized protein
MLQMKSRRGSVLRGYKQAFILSASILCIFLLTAAIAGEKQRSNASKEIRGNIFSSAVISEKEHMFVGDAGRVYLSADAGSTWQLIASGTSEQLLSVSFADKNNGWISGASGTVLNTKDGGKTWTKQKSGIDKHLFGIHFLDALHGCAVGDWGAIIVTDDGGKSWKDVRLPEDVVLYAVRMTKNGIVVVGEFGKIFNSKDGGKTWNAAPLTCPEQSLFCVAESEGNLIAGGLEGLMLYSRNGGQNWEQASSESKQAIYGMDLKGGNGYAAGDKGTILRTTDGGKTWKVVKAPFGIQLFWLGTVKILPESSGGATSAIGAGAHGFIFRLKNQDLVQ